MVKCFAHATEVANELTWDLYTAGILSSCVSTKRHPIVRKKAQMPLSCVIVKEMYTCMKFGIQGLSASYGHCPWWKRDLQRV